MSTETKKYISTIEFQHTGHICVRVTTEYIEKGRTQARNHWRGVVDPGDTDKLKKLLPNFVDEAKIIAGANHGGWEELEKIRERQIAEKKKKGANKE